MIRGLVIFFLEILKKESFQLVGANLNGQNLNDYKFSERSALIMGSESHGISNEVLALTDQTISIPGNGNAESLNIGHSAAIIINELFKINFVCVLLFTHGIILA